MSLSDVLACEKWRFLPYFERHLLKTVSIGFLLLLTLSAYDCRLSNAPISMSLSAIGDP